MSQRSAGVYLPLWVLILVVGTIVGVSMGRTYSMGLYLGPISRSLALGREPFGLAMAVTQLTIGIGAPISGGLIDRFGAGRVVAVCVLAAIAGLYWMHEASSAVDLVASGVLMGIGVSGTGVTALVGTIGRLAPPEQRLSAIASVGMAAGIGSFVALPVMHLLMEEVGWQQSLLWLMGVTALLLPLAWMISGAPSNSEDGSMPQSARDALVEALTHRGFWLLTLGFFVCGFHIAFVVVHLPTFAADQGLPPWVGPAALSTIGIANIAGTFLAGRSGRYVQKTHGLCAIYLARAVLFLGFLYLPVTPATMIVLCGLLGLIWLATIPLTSGLVATFFGTTWMSMLFGFVFLWHQIGAFLGAWLGARLFDVTQSYDVMWWLSAILAMIAGLLSWPIDEKPVSRISAGGGKPAPLAAPTR